MNKTKTVRFRFMDTPFCDDSNDLDYDNAKFITSIERHDYAEFLNMLYLMKEENQKISRDFGAVSVFSNPSSDDYECYEIDDIVLQIPNFEAQREGYEECITVYLVGGV